MNVIIIKKVNPYKEECEILQPIIGTHFKHLFPDKLFTLEEAKTICTENNYNIITICSEWALFSKQFRIQLFN